MDHGFDVGAWLEHGERELRDGFAGSALAAFREAYAVAYEKPDTVRTALAMARAYDALGRDPLAARARWYADFHRS